MCEVGAMTEEKKTNRKAKQGKVLPFLGCLPCSNGARSCSAHALDATRDKPMEAASRITFP